MGFEKSGTILPLLTQRQLEEWLTKGIIYLQDPDNPVANDWRRRSDGAFFYDERYNGSTWDIITTTGASTIGDRFIVNSLAGGLFFDGPISEERFNFVRPTTAEDEIEVGDTRAGLVLTTNNRDNLQLGYNGADLCECVEVSDSSILPEGEYTTSFTYTGSEIMTLLYLNLKVKSEIKENIQIVDSVNGRVAYSTMTDAEFIATGGRLAKDKDTGLTTGDITVNLLSVGFFIPGRTYNVKFCMCQGEVYGSPTFPFFELLGKEQLIEYVADRDWVQGLMSTTSKFLGEYTSLLALETAYPSPDAGSYGYVDLGVGQDVVSYIWDDDDSKYVLQLGESTAETPASVKSKYEFNTNTEVFETAEKADLGLNTIHRGKTDNPHSVTIAQLTGFNGKVIELAGNNYLEIDADYTHDESINYIVDTTATVVRITIEDGNLNPFTVRDALKKFDSNSCFVDIEDAGGTVIHTAELDKKDKGWIFYHNGTSWFYGEIGKGKVLAIASDHKASTDFGNLLQETDTYDCETVNDKICYSDAAHMGTTDGSLASKKYVDDHIPNFYYADSLADATTDSTSYVTKLTMTKTFPAGTYLVDVNYNCWSTEDKNDFMSQVTQDGNILGKEHIQEIKEKSRQQYLPISRKFKLDLDGEHTFNVDYKTSTTEASTVGIGSVMISITKVNLV